MDFKDLPQTLTLTTDTGGVITNFLGNWHGLSIHGFYGVWAAPNASLVIPYAPRCVRLGIQTIVMVFVYPRARNRLVPCLWTLPHATEPSARSHKC